MKGKYLLVVICVVLLIIWFGPLAPKKGLVIQKETLPRLDGKEGTSIAYAIYYEWDGEQENKPWWVIFQAPLKNGNFEWAVVEMADVEEIYDLESLMKALQSASKFDKYWFNDRMHNVQRTRLEKVQHVLLGNDELKKEKEVINKILKEVSLIE